MVFLQLAHFEQYFAFARQDFAPQLLQNITARTENAILELRPFAFSCLLPFCFALPFSFFVCVLLFRFALYVHFFVCVSFFLFAFSFFLFAFSFFNLRFLFLICVSCFCLQFLFCLCLTLLGHRNFRVACVKTSLRVHPFL